MEKQQLQNLKIWFADHVSQFYGQDEYLNANIKLKEDHTYRTCTEILYLAEQLHLNQNDKLIAETIALLHDVGRFEQFLKYRTYNDPRSTDHSTLAVQIIQRHQLLKPLPSPEQKLITTAIRLHGLLELPNNLDEQTLFFARLIRDADKIDVLYVVTEYYRQYAENPEGFKLELELPDVDDYSPLALSDVLAGRRTDYKKLHTLNDMKLLQLGWVYDVNFTAALKRIKERRLLEKLADFLPQTPDIEKAKTVVLRYLNHRITKSNQT